MKKIIYIMFIITLSISHRSAGASETVKIGAIFGMTGNASVQILEYLKSVRFAVEELNKQGGLLGKRIILVEIDNRSTPLGSRLAAKKAIDEGVIAVIGAAWSSNSLAAAGLLQKAKIPMISNISTNPDVTLVGDYIFRVCFIDSFQGRVMASFASNDLGAKTAVILTNTGNKYCIELAKFFSNNFKKRGGKILWEGDYDKDAADFSSLIEKAKKFNPDVVFIPGYVRDAALIIKQARKKGMDATFLGGDGWSILMYGYAGSELHGNYYSSHWHMNFPAKKSRRFVKEFKKRYGEIKTFGIPLAYDAVMVLADAVRRAGSFDTTLIRDSIAKTKNFEGVTGKISFDQNGDPAKEAVILQFKNGGVVYVKSIRP